MATSHKDVVKHVDETEDLSSLAILNDLIPDSDSRTKHLEWKENIEKKIQAS